MPVLSDIDIRRLVNKRRIEIRPFNEQSLTPNGYDLAIGEILVPRLNKHIREGQVNVPDLTWFVIGTKEYIRLPPKVCGQLWIRSSWARIGVISAFGKVDSGFEGTLTLSAFNASSKELKVPIGATFAQISFETLSSRPKFLYGEKRNRYQKQRGITLHK